MIFDVRKKCNINSNGFSIDTLLESNFPIDIQFIGTISIIQKLWMIIDDGRTIIKSCKFLPVILCLKKTKLFLYPIYWFSDCQLKWWWLRCLHKQMTSYLFLSWARKKFGKRRVSLFIIGLIISIQNHWYEILIHIY